MNKGLKKFFGKQMDRNLFQETFVSVLSVINKGLTDRVSQVNLEAVGCYLTSITHTFKNITQLDSKAHKYEFGVHSNQIIDNLMLKTADQNNYLK